MTTFGGMRSAPRTKTGCVDALFAAQHEWDILAAWLDRRGSRRSVADSHHPHHNGLRQRKGVLEGALMGSLSHNVKSEWISSLDTVEHEFRHGIDPTTPGGVTSAR